MKYKESGVDTELADKLVTEDNIDKITVEHKVIGEVISK